jgi:hypothetical protein
MWSVLRAISYALLAMAIYVGTRVRQ